MNVIAVLDIPISLFTYQIMRDWKHALKMLRQANEAYSHSIRSPRVLQFICPVIAKESETYLANALSMPNKAHRGYSSSPVVCQLNHSAEISN